MSVLAEFSMTPLDKGESVGRYVTRCLDVVDRSGLPYRLGPMGTCVEGEWDEVMHVITQCYRRLAEDCARVSISIKLDCRRDKTGRLDSKIESVEKELGRAVRK
jgi:uncharacterized protein (TIGR00106 family)